jgi:hypothetical protein
MLASSDGHFLRPAQQPDVEVAFVEAQAATLNEWLRAACGQPNLKLKKYGYPIVNAQPFLSISADLG